MDVLYLIAKNMDVRHYANKHTLMLLAVSSLLFIVACSSSVRYTSVGNAGYSGSIAVNPRPTSNQTGNDVKVIIPGQEIRGFASFYGDEFDGRLTSNGEVFDQRKYTAAHKTLPFGTKLKVKNLKNNRVVYVRVNDRGPFVEGRELDLSRVAAERLEMVNDGVAQVSITVMQ